MDKRRIQEVEAKRAKLEELRRAREQRKTARAADGKASTDNAALERPASAARRAQLDDYVSSLLGSDTPASSSAAGTPALQYGLSSGRSTCLSDAPGTSDRENYEPQRPAATQTDAEPHARGPSAPSGPNFTDASQALFELAPKPRVMYEKGIQTSLVGPVDAELDGLPTGGVGSSTIDEAEMRERISRELEDEQHRLDQEIAVEKKRRDQELEEERRRGLPPELLESIFASPDFSTFLDSSSKIVQRALNDDYDYLRDYSIVGDGLGDDADAGRVTNVCAFSDPRWTAHRSVTAVDWSLKFVELSCAAYNKNPLAMNDPNGLVCVWNLHMVQHPEYIFYAPSDVLSCTFSAFHPNYLIGGTYSGQILLWDTRAKHMPILKTPLSAAGHTHPVYSLAIIGTQNAHNLVSASTDGMICAWTLDMLARPQETLDLIYPAHAKTDEVSITALAFPDNEATTFYVGSEEGAVFLANRYDRAGAKAGLVSNEIYRGHAASITGLHFHPLHGAVDFSDLFLTSSVDWTVKLWRAKGVNTSTTPSAAPAAAATGAAAQTASTVHPIHSFEDSDDYVFDVRWHPVHPAVFGTVDGAGRFDVWNLNADTEVPISTTHVSPDAPRGLNKLAWDRRDGRRAALGSSDGNVYVYDVGTLATPAENEWELTRKTIANLMADRDQDAKESAFAGRAE